MGCAAWRTLLRSGGRRLRQVTLPAIAALFCASGASAQTIVTPVLQNISFGAVPSLYSDLTSAQNTCSFTGLLPVTYNIVAGGSGTNGAFTLTNGKSTIPYEVQWAQTANATSGTPLTTNVVLSGQVTAALLSGLTCALGVANATLIVIVRSISLQQATAGAYTGTLTVLLAAQ
jgi:hypothetical protein